MELLPCKGHEVLEIWWGGGMGVWGRLSSGRLKRGGLLNSVSVSDHVNRRNRTSDESFVVQVLNHVPLFCNPMDCSLPGFSVHGILQARKLEWVAISFSRGSSLPRD